MMVKADLREEKKGEWRNGRSRRDNALEKSEQESQAATLPSRLVDERSENEGRGLFDGRASGESNDCRKYGEDVDECETLRAGVEQSHDEELRKKSQQRPK